MDLRRPDKGGERLEVWNKPMAGRMKETWMKETGERKKMGE